MSSLNPSEISALVDRAALVMSRVVSLDTAMRSLHAASVRDHEALSALGEDAAGLTGGAGDDGLAALRLDIADLGTLVREEFAHYGHGLAQVHAALAELSAVVAAHGATRSEATDLLAAELQALSTRLGTHEDQMEAASAGATLSLHELTQSIGDERETTREHVAALQAGAEQAADAGAQAGERSHQHAEQVAQALRDEIGVVGQGLALAAERVQASVERSVDREIHLVVREAVRRVREMFHQLLGRMHHSQGDLRGIRELLASLFERLESISAEAHAEAQAVHAHQESLEDQLRQHESERDEEHD